MKLAHNGLAKLVEEIGELGQICGKFLQYPELQVPTGAKHPDGTDLRARMSEELADVTAVVGFVIQKLGLDPHWIAMRAAEKFRQFKVWDAEGGQ